MNRPITTVYNDETGEIEFRVALTDGTGDHVLATVVAVAPPTVDAATLPAAPPVPVESPVSDDPEETVYGTPEGF